MPSGKKGGNDNASGPLRCWIPSSTNLDTLSVAELQDIVMCYNLTPGKCLSFKTQFQAMLAETGKHVQIRFN